MGWVFGCAGCHDDAVYLVYLVCLVETNAILLMQSIRTMGYFVKSLRSTDLIHQKDEMDQIDLLFLLLTRTRPAAQYNERPDGQDRQPERRIPI